MTVMENNIIRFIRRFITQLQYMLTKIHSEILLPLETLFVAQHTQHSRTFNCTIRATSAFSFSIPFHRMDDVHWTCYIVHIRNHNPHFHAFQMWTAPLIGSNRNRRPICHIVNLSNRTE